MAAVRNWFLRVAVAKKQGMVLNVHKELTGPRANARMLTVVTDSRLVGGMNATGSLRLILMTGLSRQLFHECLSNKPRTCLDSLADRNVRRAPAKASAKWQIAMLTRLFLNYTA